MDAMTNTTNRTRAVACAGLICLFCCGLAAVAGADTDPWKDRIRQAIEDAACARNGFSSDYVEVDIHRTRVPHEFRGATSITAELPEYDDAVGPVTARAYFKAKGKTLGSIAVPAAVNVYAEALVTTHRIGRHDVITQRDLETKKLDITKMVKWAMTDADSVVGLRSKRTINPGQLVDRRWLEAVPLIHRGDRVMMEYSSGAVKVTANVVAMEDGYRDEEIMVKNSRAKRLMSAIVVDGNTVAPAR